MSKKSEIGHFARIPLHVARADISETAKGLWRELAFLSSPRPQVWVRQESFAQKLNKCVKTVQRALKELAAAGLIKFAGWYQGRYKWYKLAWKKFFAQDGQECPTTSDTTVVGPKTPASDHVEQESPAIIREVEKNSEQSKNSFSERIAEHVQRWQERFKCLDGKNGRPTLKECIDHAMGHKARHNYDDPITFLEWWLRNAGSKWMVPYQQELAAAPSTRESMRAYEEMREKKQAEDFAYYWPKIQEANRKREEERRIELGLA